MSTVDSPLCMYAVYDHPGDFPDEYVVRRWSIVGRPAKPVPDAELTFRSRTIEGVRLQMHLLGLVPLTRTEHDDPCIVEVWL